ncbi:MAG: serine hydrolase domain-containing protein [Planctomycetota bacterium]
MLRRAVVLSLAWLASPSFLPGQTDLPGQADLPAKGAPAAATREGQPDPRREELRQRLAAFCERTGTPGATAAVALPDGRVFAVAAGVRESGRDPVMQQDDRMFCGSIGKTWFAEVALDLVAADKLSLDDAIADHLGDEPWFARLPNHEAITVRNLMRHDSGLPRWIEMPGALAEMAKPDRRWRNGEQVSFVLDKPPVHPAGQGWAYSDTNYIVLGLIVEKVTGEPIYATVQKTVLDRYELRDTVPGNRRSIDRLVQGHARMFHRFGFPERSLDVSRQPARLRFDPSSEWCGGGIVTTAGDLARWARIFGRQPRRNRDGVRAKALGGDTRYGLGVMLRDGALGPTRGHDGVFIGYSATMVWFERHDLGIAVLCNCDTAGAGLQPLALELAKVALGGGTSGSGSPESGSTGSGSTGSGSTGGRSTGNEARTGK